eukprot:GHVN01003002.1.p1 GENE.GHVN01003002.1~~GHVN01003002.1.p1  ORF type:complete len:640 (+),score=161.99 GHVN01003002.1:54-1973(+)
MTDYWVSSERHHCKICECWTSGHPRNIDAHNKSDRHKANQQKAMTNMRNKEREKEREAAAVQAELAHVEKAARASAANDAQYFGGRVGASGSSGGGGMGAVSKPRLGGAPMYSASAAAAAAVARAAAAPQNKRPRHDPPPGPVPMGLGTFPPYDPLKWQQKAAQVVPSLEDVGGSRPTAEQIATLQKMTLMGIDVSVAADQLTTSDKRQCWTALIDPVSNRIFYFNPLTSESRWEQPPNAYWLTASKGDDTPHDGSKPPHLQRRGGKTRDSDDEDDENDDEEEDDLPPAPPVLPHMIGLSSTDDGPPGIAGVPYAGILGTSIVPAQPIPKDEYGNPILCEASLPTPSDISMMGELERAHLALPPSVQPKAATGSTASPLPQPDSPKLNPELVAAYFQLLVAAGTVRQPQAPPAPYVQDTSNDGRVPKPTRETAQSNVEQPSSPSGDTSHTPTQNDGPSSSALLGTQVNSSSDPPLNAIPTATPRSLQATQPPKEDEVARPEAAPGGWIAVAPAQSAFGDSVAEEGEGGVGDGGAGLGARHRGNRLDRQGSHHHLIGGGGTMMDPLSVALLSVENEPELNADDLKVNEKPMFQKKSLSGDGKATFAKRGVFGKKKKDAKAAASSSSTSSISETKMEQIDN